MEIIWSNIATKHLKSILEYVENEFGEYSASYNYSTEYHILFMLS